MVRGCDLPLAAGSQAEMGDQLKQAAERAAGAFRALFLTFWPKVRAMLLCQGADAKTAEAIAQDTLRAVWCKSQHIAHDGSNLPALVYASARNLRIDRVRHHAVWQGYSDEFGAGERPKGSESPVAPRGRGNGGMHGEICSALEALTPDELQIIRLCFVDGLSQDEIATKLALPLGTVNFRTRQAFHKLRCAIESRS